MSHSECVCVCVRACVRACVCAEREFKKKGGLWGGGVERLWPLLDFQFAIGLVSLSLYSIYRKHFLHDSMQKTFYALDTNVHWYSSLPLNLLLLIFWTHNVSYGCVCSGACRRCRRSEADHRDVQDRVKATIRNEYNKLGPVT